MPFRSVDSTSSTSRPRALAAVRRRDGSIWNALQTIAHAGDPTECNILKGQLTSQPGHMHTQQRVDHGYAKDCPSLDPDFWRAYVPTSTRKQCDVIKDQLERQPGHMHTQQRVDGAFGMNCQTADPDFWKSYEPSK